MHSIDNKNNYREIIKLNLLQSLFSSICIYFFFHFIFIIKYFVYLLSNFYFLADEKEIV